MIARLRALLPLLWLCACTGAARPGGEVRLTLIHFSDYHSHAVPYYSEHAPGQGGIARAIGFLRRTRAAIDPGRGQGLLVLSGGDMMNAGSPAWSDRYGCAEWAWLSGLVDAMALGNHDLDYGWDALAACRAGASFPLLSGNLAGADGAPLLAPGGHVYLVKEVAGLRIGIFALAGPDFGKLVRPGKLPAGARFTDGMAAAREIVATLRGAERVSAVVFIGHQDRETDFAMARQVPGIDVILGSHSHYKGAFQTIPGTRTVFISPSQYLGYVSRVDLRFQGGALRGATGALVKMDAGVPEDPEIAARVQRMEAELEADPAYRDRFAVIGRAAVELSDEGIAEGESVLGNFVMDVLRQAGGGDVALSTASSFRAAIPPGPIRREDYLAALPYRNRLIRLTMTGRQVQQLLDLAVSKLGSDNFAVTSGVRYGLGPGRALGVQVGAGGRFAALDLNARYRVLATDYLVRTAAGYSDILRQAEQKEDSAVTDVNDALMAYIAAHGPVSAHLDGRVRR